MYKGGGGGGYVCSSTNLSVFWVVDFEFCGARSLNSDHHPRYLLY
jgi:hypothetical protein